MVICLLSTTSGISKAIFLTFFLRIAFIIMKISKFYSKLLTKIHTFVREVNKFVLPFEILKFFCGTRFARLYSLQQIWEITIFLRKPKFSLKVILLWKYFQHDSLKTVLNMKNFEICLERPKSNRTFRLEKFYKRFPWKIVKLSMIFLEGSPRGQLWNFHGNHQTSCHFSTHKILD